MNARDDIRAGDVVVALANGALFRVAEVIWGTRKDGTPGLGLILREIDHRVAGPQYRGWNADGFRKLEPAEDCFTEAMQRLIEPAPAKPSIVAELRSLNFGGW